MKKDSTDTTKERDSGKAIKRPLVAIAVPSTKLLLQLEAPIYLLKLKG